MATVLLDYLQSNAARWPDRLAVVDPTGQRLTYGELQSQSSRLANFLASQGVSRGDRVGIVLPKTLNAVISLFGVMKAGAAYVPIDFNAPLERSKGILADCQVKAVIVDERSLGVVPEGVTCVIVVRGSEMDFPGDARADLNAPGPDDLAYILYTSGSTGIPKGVMLTHRNALGYIDWCTSVFHPTENDRFSSHAPFHFDLSVLDLYLAVKHGASIYLIPDELGKKPKELARFIENNRLTIWYSTPSILTLLLQYGKIDQIDVSSIRLVLFAGEVFPVKHLRALKKCWPKPEYYNLYGPTETNVCTFARIPDTIPDDREAPYPIGFPCSHYTPLVLDSDRNEVPVGSEGLLYMAGPSVFQGYWNRPAENAAAFIDRDGKRWYNTGDVVRWDPKDGFIYLGRRDRMVKRRGFRIELGEIEKALYRHPKVQEAAVIAIPNADAGVEIIAFLAFKERQNESIIELKTFCASNLPTYMSPDRFLFRERLPRTSTDKTDYQGLKKELEVE